MAKKKNIPYIRFKGFSDEWEECELGEVTDLLTGNPFESKKFVKEGIFLVRGMNVKRGYLDMSENISEYWSSSDGLENYLLKNGDILIQMDGALIGKSYAKIQSKSLPALLVQRVTRIRSGKVNNEFIYQYIQRDFLSYIRTIKTETAVPHLSLNDIRNFRIVTSKPKEQTKIGNYFKNLDQLITQHQQKYDKLLTIKKAMLKKMFPQNGANVPEIRFKGFTEAWEEKTLGEIFDYERPDNFIVENDEYSDDFNTPVLTANKGFILGYTNETRTYNKESIIFDDFTLDSKYINFPYMIKSSAIKILTIRDKNKCNLKFAFELLNITEIEIMGHARHYISVVQPTFVLVPKIKEQKQIAKYFNKIDKIINLHQSKLEKLKTIKKAFLDKMFV